MIPCMQRDQIDYKTLYERIQLNSIPEAPETKEVKTSDEDQTRSVKEDSPQTSLQESPKKPQESLLDRENINEEKMLDIAEVVLNNLAKKIIENGWSIHDVFGQPDEIVRVIPVHNDETDIKVLTP